MRQCEKKISVWTLEHNNDHLMTGGAYNHMLSGPLIKNYDFLLQTTPIKKEPLKQAERENLRKIGKNPKSEKNRKMQIHSCPTLKMKDSGSFIHLLKKFSKCCPYLQQDFCPTSD